MPDEPLLLDEEEVPRAGLRIARGPQYAPWTAGETHLWMARRKRIGRREGWSGLRFDEIQPVVGERRESEG